MQLAFGMRQVKTMDNKLGKKASNYKYDQSKRNLESKAFYNSKEWIKCRKMVLMRDRYLCRECFKKKKIVKADVVHHIKELVDYPELALILNNLESLCHACHNNIHADKGKNDTVQVDNGIVKFTANPDII